MHTRTIALALATLGLALTCITNAGAGQHADDAPMMQKAVEHYAAIGDALARDTVDGVAAHAQSLQDMMPETSGAENDRETQDGEHMGMHGNGDDHASMARTHGTMKEALKALSASDASVEEARSAFADLSSAFVPMAQKHAAASGADTDYVVVHCPMAPGNGDWIQRKGKTANPFHGSKMLRCGNRLGDLGASATGEKMRQGDGKPDDDSMHGSMGHGEHGQER